MKTRISYIIGLMLGLLAVSNSSQAQQSLSYTQYGNTITPLNPAASLLRPEGEMTILGRRQWTGVEGAPEGFWLSGYLPIESASISIGVNVRHESLAIEQTSELSAFAAKAVRISEKEYLALSLSLGVSNYHGNFSQVDPNDPAFANMDLRETDALAGFGVMLYRPGSYYAGISLPRLSLNDLGSGGTNRQYRIYKQYHLTAGMLLPLGTDFHIRPAALVTLSDNLSNRQQTRAEVSALLWIKQSVGLGANMRTDGDLAGMAQLNVQRLGIGYSYQFNPGNRPLNRQVNNATHEIALSYRFGKASVSLL